MAATSPVSYNGAVIKIEDSPEPTPACAPSQVYAPITTAPAEPPANWAPPTLVADPKDPEGFLRRCSGCNKKTKLRCSATIGRNSQHARNSHPTYLPTCYTHRDQQSFAGWCQFMQRDGERCGRLFRWTPPYFELCSEHQGHPDTPCYFLNLPLELRLEIFRYLLPSVAIGSSSSPLHQDTTPPPVAAPPPPFLNATSGIFVPFPPPPLAPLPRARNRNHPPKTEDPGRIFPVPLLNLLLINRQIYEEVKDFLFSTIPFTIDIRKDGTFMCGRRLLEPRRADGLPHYAVDDAEAVAKKFVATFDFASVKNYNVDILVENWNCGPNATGPHSQNAWDEEVEIYDIRDYVGVAVSGILGKSRNLCKLNVRLGLSKFRWSEEELLENTKRLVGPFERLRNVRQPRFCGVFEGTARTPFMINTSRLGALSQPLNATRPTPSICSVPRLPTHTYLLGPGNRAFDAYKESWERWLSQTAAAPPKKPPIRAMFTEFKQFYTKLSTIVPEVQRTGRAAFLHRARVARENEDVEAFRHLRNELIVYWETYLDQEETKKNDMNSRLCRMLDTDIYPSNESEESGRRDSSSSISSSPVVLDVDKMTEEGIPMQANPVNDKRGRQYSAMLQRQMQSQALPLTQPLTCQGMGTAQLQAHRQQRVQQAQQQRVQQAQQQRVQQAQQQRVQQAAQQAIQQAMAAHQQATFLQRQQHAFRTTVAQPQNVTMPIMPQQQQNVMAAVSPNGMSSSPAPNFGSNLSAVTWTHEPASSSARYSSAINSIPSPSQPNPTIITVDDSDFNIPMFAPTNFEDNLQQEPELEFLDNPGPSSSVDGSPFRQRRVPDLSSDDGPLPPKKKRRLGSPEYSIISEGNSIDNDSGSMLLTQDLDKMGNWGSMLDGNDMTGFEVWGMDESAGQGKGKGKARVEVMVLD
ncbi:hypothetical protein K469DRAFT_311294 [Zopfia rhizophila CBS 207.26]|uniref:Uncharacterized protein n=1 Tax=Zopfia rhizophila CBS 207.26 TaxID=1314779 RepID=A0A6A6ER80_9PEZI|nr:hypothetical protein K469DRAFT_311294 [Zopfia rhizophila CBS 207.26]